MNKQELFDEVLGLIEGEIIYITQDLSSTEFVDYPETEINFIEKVMGELTGNWKDFLLTKMPEIKKSLGIEESKAANRMDYERIQSIYIPGILALKAQEDFGNVPGTIVPDLDALLERDNCYGIQKSDLDRLDNESICGSKWRTMTVKELQETCCKHLVQEGHTVPTLP